MHYFPQYDLDTVLNMGYYRVMRLWSIADELKARDLQQLANIVDNPYCKQERREEVFESLSKRQVRRNVQNKPPPEVLERLKNLQRLINDG